MHQPKMTQAKYLFDCSTFMREHSRDRFRNFPDKSDFANPCGPHDISVNDAETL